MRQWRSKATPLAERGARMLELLHVLVPGRGPLRGGADTCDTLDYAFERLNLNPTAAVATGQRRKWEELLRLTQGHEIQLLLVADAAPWWYSASGSRTGVELEPLG